MGLDRIRIGIAGLGTVGAEVARQIIAHHSGRYALTACCVRDRAKVRDINYPADIVWVDRPSDLVDHCDIVVELMGGTGAPVAGLFDAALAAGKPIVTANKAWLAVRPDFIHHPLVRFEAAVAGGIPVIACVRDMARAGRIGRISGILNGTCNFILSMMEQSPDLSFEAALRKAQDLGFAEADPALDLNGDDSLQKAVILAHLAWPGRSIRHHCAGIGPSVADDVSAAHETGTVLRLVATVEADGTDSVKIDVSPRPYEAGSDLANVKGAQNAVLIEGEPFQSLFLKGYGAGAGPTASAILADIMAFGM